jgi:hypothetical protein
MISMATRNGRNPARGIGPATPPWRRVKPCGPSRAVLPGRAAGRAACAVR